MVKHVIVGVYHKVGAIKIITPGLECMDHSKELLLTGWVIPFILYEVKATGRANPLASI
jgi:hypothetical protein